MNEARGLCLISIPKSGTMFLSGYLEKISQCKAVFGLERRSAAELARELTQGWHPDIQAAADDRSIDLASMCRRFALMLNRNRPQGDCMPTSGIVTDHGYTSFLQFLINPSPDQIACPRMLIQWARDRSLAPVFLYRPIPEVANSLALFLASGKSFLLILRSIEQAADIVTNLHAPVLAAQTAAWLDIASEQNVLALSYQELIADPSRWIAEVARQSMLPIVVGKLSEDPAAYRPWTYRRRSQMSASWCDTFNPRQQAVLRSLCPVHREAP
jgi:hypothetical protein